MAMAYQTSSLMERATFGIQHWLSEGGHRLHGDDGAGPLQFVPPSILFAWVDQRVITTSFAAEETLTSDTVPVNVDAVLFWMVYDPEKAALEVQDGRHRRRSATSLAGPSLPIYSEAVNE